MTVPRAATDDEKGALTKRIANERIVILFKLAEQNLEARPELSNEYAKLIRELAMHYRIKLAKRLSSHICRGCGAFLEPGISASVRVIAKQRLRIYTCNSCSTQKKVYY
ncbi:MAG: ribonuclease P [Candidatus Micrarchaeota archaeon]|nr:ribonuclease P [Candidatus Micrarchaeota archaeon]